MRILASIVLLLATGSIGAVAQTATPSPYQFTPAPQLDLNRIYRIDRTTGEVGACQYGLKEGSVGVTLCFGSGEGATAQAASDYTLIASRHEREGGVFRVDQRTGAMSVCYVFDDQVVCTAPEATAPKIVQAPSVIAPAPVETTGSLQKKN
jgi:hypothetical protein